LPALSSASVKVPLKFVLAASVILIVDGVASAPLIVYVPTLDVATLSPSD
jgi:hypothetical protein